MVRLNEVGEAEQLLNSKQKVNLKDLVLLAKYFKHIKIDVESNLRNYIISRTPSYNQVVHDKYIELATKNAEDNSLRLSYIVPITQKEIDTIKTITNLKARRVYFCILMVAKYYFLNPARDGVNVLDRMDKEVYFNNSFKDVFTLAKATYNRKERENIIIELVNGGYLDLTETHKYIVKHVDIKGEPIDTIQLSNNFVYYIYQLEEDNIIRCVTCGDYVRTKNKSHNQKYCSKCRGIQQRENTKKRVKKHRSL